MGQKSCASVSSSKVVGSSGVHHSHGGSELPSTCRTLSSVCEKAYMEIFSDAGWASKKQNRRSVSATCILVAACLLHSAPRTQKLIYFIVIWRIRDVCS